MEQARIRSLPCTTDMLVLTSRRNGPATPKIKYMSEYVYLGSYTGSLLTIAHDRTAFKQHPSFRMLKGGNLSRSIREFDQEFFGFVRNLEFGNREHQL